MSVSSRFALAFALPLGAAACLTAQSAPPSSTASPTTVLQSPSPSGEGTITMQEFQVNETSPNSYIASETMTGSRVATKILDLPYSIVNLTHEFFQDYNIEILDENMTYIGGLTDINIGGSFNLRGFSSTSQLRDGFYRLGRYGLSNIQEVEIIRGPNAAIYGRSSPGGMINFISLPPKQENQQTVTISKGSYGQNLANLELTGSIDPRGKLYYVVNVNQTERGYPGGDSHIRNNEDFAAVEYDFSEDAHLKVSGEYFLQTQHAPQTSAPLVFQARTPTADNAATSTAVGIDYGLGTVDPYGPQSELNRGSGTFELTYDQRFNDEWSTRLGLYRFGARRWDYNQNTGWGSITIPLPGATTTVNGVAVPTPTVSTRGSLPSRGEIMEDGGGFQEDVVNDHWAFGHSVEFNTLGTVDLNDYYRWDPTWEYGTNTDPTVVAWNASTTSPTYPLSGMSSGRAVALAPQMYNGRIDLMPTGPVSYFPNWYNPANLTLFQTPQEAVTGGPALNGGTLTRRRTTSLGGNIRERVTALNNRLIAFAGLRIDNVLFSQRDYTVAFNSVGFGYVPPGSGGPLQANGPGGSVVRRYVHQRNPDVGFNYLLLPDGEGGDAGLHVYGSYSTAYFVDQTSRPSVIASSTYAPFTARGFDYGIKGSYLAGRLNFTVGGYYDREYNVLVTDIVEYAPGEFTEEPEQDGDQLVRGFESDASWVFTKPDITIGESWGYVNAIYTYFGSGFPEVPGRPAQNIPKYNGSVYAKWNIDSGPLQGLYLNVLCTAVARDPKQAPNAGDTITVENGVPVLTAQTGQWKIDDPGFTLWNFGIHYRLPRFSSQWDQTVGINFNNIFNRYYLITSMHVGDGHEVLFEYTLNHF